MNSQASSRTRRCPTVWVGVVLLLLSSAALRAQGAGRWWWEASLGYGQRTSDNLIEDDLVNAYDQQDLRLALNVNGFVVDPGVGRFRLGLDLLLSQLEGGRDIDEERVGGNAELQLFPRGKVPIRMSFERRLFEFSELDSLDPLASFGLPDTNTRWGTQIRVRKGPLSGTVVGAERNEVTFLDQEAGDDLQDRQFLEWSRGVANAQHYLRLDRVLRQYGAIGLELEDFTLNVSERFQPSDAWSWQLTGTGISRTVVPAVGAETQSESFRLRNRVFHTVGQDDLVEINYNLDLFRTDSSSTSRGHDALVLYRWRTAGEWELAPFAQYIQQRGDDLTLRSPRLGLSLTWSRPTEVWSTTWTARASYGQVDLTDAEKSADDSDLVLFLTGSVAHGLSDGFRQEWEVELSRNELRIRREPITGLPDLGTALFGLGTEDFARSRLTLKNSWGRRWVQLWGEWNSRQATGFATRDGFDAETLTATLRFGSGRFDVGSSLGQTSIRRETTADQDVDSLSVTLGIRPARAVNLRASYRNDVRALLLVPDIDTHRYDVIATIRLLGFIVEGRGFESSERILGGIERINRGVVWSISRRFAGWLPIVTGAGPRGVIR